MPVRQHDRAGAVTETICANCNIRANRYRIGWRIQIAVMGEMVFGEPTSGEASIFRQLRLFAKHRQFPLPRDGSARIEERGDIKVHAYPAPSLKSRFL